MKTWVLRNLQQFHHWLLHPFLLLPFQRFRPAHIPVSGYLGAHLTSRKGTPRAPTITLRAQLDHSCSSCRQPQLCPQPWLWGSDKSALRTGEDKVAKQSKTPNRHTQLIIYVIKYSVWYLHFSPSPSYFTAYETLLTKFTFLLLFPYIHICISHPCASAGENPCQNTPEPLRQRKTTILSPIAWLEGFSVPVTRQYLYLISAFQLIVMIEEVDF